MSAGPHCLKVWTQKQQVVALSSAESELYAAVKTASEGLGIRRSATMCSVNRRGLGKAKHVDMHNLWIQEASKSGWFTTRKVGTNVNPADLMTKPLGYEFMGDDVVDRSDDTFATWSSVLRDSSSGGDVGKDVGAASISVKCSDRWWVAEHPFQLRRLSWRCGSCQRIVLTQFLLQTEVFNESQARARGEVVDWWHIDGLCTTL